jgi:phosphodiesterase/alkaline phosphatase D-like protein
MARRSLTVASFIALLVLVGAAPDARAQATYNSVHLSWTASGDDSLTGTASQYDLRFSTSPITAANFASATRASNLPAPTAPGTTQGVTVAGLNPNTTYWFAIKTGDDIPNWSLISNVVSVATLAAPDTIRPAHVTTLAVSVTTDSTAMLTWTAVGNDSLTGTATSYDLRVSTSPITAANFSSATAVSPVPTPTAAGSSQSCVVHNLGREVTYYFAIKVSDAAGNTSAMSNVPSATTPDTMPPAAVHNLAVGFLWFGGTSVSAALPRNEVRP